MVDLMISFEITRPKDHKLIGSEAPELCEIMLRLSAHTKKRVVDPILAGFKHNFETESSAEGPWQKLAPMTVRERTALQKHAGGLVPGFGPEHPILQRFGDYKASWVDRESDYHLEEWNYPEVIPIGAGRTYTIPVIHVEVGSTHPHVAKLSGGPDEGFEEFIQQEWTEDMFEEQFQYEGGGALPPRPVHPIQAEFETQLQGILDWIYRREAERIPRRPFD